ncbi:alpha/beta hydrolase [Vibrio gangliei]|uniref:alpha/beta hydrolase n=1 Tax=Vibrio gangliei TaxID=2077090 RepID=UPI00130064F1|nr:alpha/beta hydrolase-fold protein [Vibrio gangliei]
MFTKHTLTSSILKQDRVYTVYLPKEYHRNSQQTFPVLYLLDGDKHLLQVAGILNSFQDGLTPRMPATILVAVHNIDRMKDFTPTHTMKLPNGEQAGDWYQHTGGGEDFLHFLSAELQPHINQQYRTQAPNILVGHSLGGLESLYAASQSDVSFQAFISIDPSLWFDFPKNYHAIEKGLTANVVTSKAIYFAIANNPYTPGFGLSTFHRDHLQQFAQEFNQKTNESVSFQCQFYAEHDHHSVYHQAVYDGLVWLFEGYNLSGNLAEFSVEQILQQYVQLNKKLGSQLKPDQQGLLRLKTKGQQNPKMGIPVKKINELLAYYYSEGKKSR